MAIALVLLVLVAAGVVRERTLRGRAEAEARKAGAVEQYLVSVFGVSNPLASPETRGADVTARALLDRGAARIDSSLANQPDVQAELRGVLGSVYAGLGLFDKAVNLAKVLRDDGHAIDAEKLLRGVMSHLDAANPAQRDLSIGVYVALGTTLTNLGRAAEAMPLLERAFTLSRERFGANDWRTGEAQLALGVCLGALRQPARAEPLLREAAEKIGPHRSAQPRLASQAERALAQVRDALNRTHP